MQLTANGAVGGRDRRVGLGYSGMASCPPGWQFAKLAGRDSICSHAAGQGGNTLPGQGTTWPAGHVPRARTYLSRRNGAVLTCEG